MKFLPYEKSCYLFKFVDFTGESLKDGNLIRQVKRGFIASNKKIKSRLGGTTAFQESFSKVNSLFLFCAETKVVIATYNGVDYTEPKKIQAILNHYQIDDVYAEKELKLPK